MVGGTPNGHPVDRDALLRIELLRPLPPRTLGELAKVANCRTYAKGMQIERCQDGQEPVMRAVINGAVRIEFQSPDGRELCVRDLTNGQLFMLEDLSVGAVDDPVAKILVSQTILCEIPHVAFEQEEIGCREAARLLIADQRGWIKALSGVASDRLHRSPELRIRRVLWRETLEQTDQTIQCTYDDIAAKAGADRASVCRVMGVLRRERVVQVDPADHRITVLDASKLAGE